MSCNRWPETPSTIEAQRRTGGPFIVGLTSILAVACVTADLWTNGTATAITAGSFACVRLGGRLGWAGGAAWLARALPRIAPMADVFLLSPERDPAGWEAL